MRKDSAFEACIVILLFLLVGLLALAVSSPAKPDSWEVNGTSIIDYMTIGSDDTLYLFSGNNITAIRDDGQVAWTYPVPKNLELFLWLNSGPVMAEDSGHLYLYAFEKLTEAEIRSAEENHGWDVAVEHPSRLISISPGGQEEWVYQFNLSLPSNQVHFSTYWDGYSYPCTVSVKKHGNRIYFFHGGTEEVLDSNGRQLFCISNLSAPAVVDERGYVYGVRAYRPALNYSEGYAQFCNRTPGVDYREYLRLHEDPTATLPTDVVEAYYPNGSLAWSQHIGNQVCQGSSLNGWILYDRLPFYGNGMLYVPVPNGIAKLRSDGAYMWTCQIPDGNYALFDLMPFDDSGNVYMESLINRPYEEKVEVCTISSDGYVQPGSWAYDVGDSWGTDQPYVGSVPLASRNGVVYTVESNGPIDGPKFNETLRTMQFGSRTITAYDVKGNGQIWNFSVPMDDRHVGVFDEGNYKEFLLRPERVDIGPDTDRWLKPGEVAWTNETQPLTVVTTTDVRLCPGANVTYINYNSAIFEHPVIFNRSRCLYARGLYAVDNNGSLLWSMPVDGFVENIVANNESLYYVTRDGRIGSTGIPEVAAGVTFAAAVYMFLRFFMIGAVARARHRIDQNENRNEVLQYVIDHPGSAANEISRATGLNHGTVRYHLSVLTLNHKVVTYEDGGKYLRYFKNSGAFTPGERAFLALARREPVRKVLEVLEAKPGLTGLEISKELGVSSTAAHRHIGLLVESGIIDRKPHIERGYVYTIKDEYRQQVARISTEYCS